VENYDSKKLYVDMTTNFNTFSSYEWNCQQYL